MTPRQLSIAAAAAGALSVLPGGADAAQPAQIRSLAAESLAMTKEMRDALADFHLRDVQPVSSLIPEIMLHDDLLRIRAARAVIDARVINIFLIRKARIPAVPRSATTAEAIDSWTNTVMYGAPQGYGTSVDQWVAMAYFLGPRM